MLLLKYPNNHQIIRRALKLSKSSFCRLRQELKNDSYGEVQSTRSWEVKWSLKSKRRNILKLLWLLQLLQSRWMEFRSEIMDLSSQTPTRRSIINFLKAELKYKYMQWSSRSVLSRDKAKIYASHLWLQNAWCYL